MCPAAARSTGAVLGKYSIHTYVKHSPNLAERRRGVAGAWGQVARKRPHGMKEPR